MTCCWAKTGKVSKAAAVLMGSFGVTSWVVVFQTINKTLTDLTFSAYIAGLGGPDVAKLIKGNGPPQASTETVINQKTTAPAESTPP